MAHIMIAEHNEQTAAYLYQALKQTGNTVTVATTATEAWGAVNGYEDYDILMVDVMTPGLDGFVLAQKALQQDPGLQIIFITGFAAVAMDTYNTPSFAPAPMTSRPFHIRDMPARVRYMMGEAEMPQHHMTAYPVTQATEDGATNNNVVYADFNRKKAG